MSANATSMDDLVQNSGQLRPGESLPQQSPCQGTPVASTIVGPKVKDSNIHPTTEDVKQSVEFQQRIARLKKEYDEYAASQQQSFTPPQAQISLDDNAEGVEVHIDTEFNRTRYHFESIKLKHIDAMYQNLYSQPIVRAKYGNGKPLEKEKTTELITNWSYRFKRKDEKLMPQEPNPFSAFVVTDAETNDFLGMTVIGMGSIPGTPEMAQLNAEKAWSCVSETIVREYSEGASKSKPKIYSGTGTAEVCTMLQYATFLKMKGYKFNGRPPEAVVETARVDNPGSWKSGAKAGMVLTDINVKPEYGPELRYHLRKTI